MPMMADRVYKIARNHRWNDLFGIISTSMSVAAYPLTHSTLSVSSVYFLSDFDYLNKALLKLEIIIIDSILFFIDIKVYFFAIYRVFVRIFE